MSGPLEEWHRVAAQFGVGIEQVRRDHLISHVLAALARSLPTDDVVFFGGTALSRTFLVDARLSEDVDLIALAPRAEVARAIEHAVARGLARTHGRVGVGRARAHRFGRDGRLHALRPDGASAGGLGLRVRADPVDVGARPGAPDRAHGDGVRGAGAGRRRLGAGEHTVRSDVPHRQHAGG